MGNEVGVTGLWVAVGAVVGVAVGTEDGVPVGAVVGVDVGSELWVQKLG